MQMVMYYEDRQASSILAETLFKFATTYLTKDVLNSGFLSRSSGRALPFHESGIWD
jgi:hypothetical protein